jgi:AraC family transcriptional regulator of adaptative response/methylated-DNA-[protein]-cysteine methyltransferase
MARSDYERVAATIAYLEEHARRQPSLAELAAHVHLSPFHFQRLFARWTGVTPKRFLQALTLEQAKTLLLQTGSLLEVTDALGLSSGSRLHDHFVQLDAVTPGEYRRRGDGLSIAYGVHDSPFGTTFVAQTPRGICRLAFLDATAAVEVETAALARAWPGAIIAQDMRATRLTADRLASTATRSNRPLSLHVAGTNFQIAVWRALLTVPFGASTTYAQIARAAGAPQAIRAAGTAIGANPVAFFIPCHRVIRASGALGGYRWGLTRKVVLRAWEQARSLPPDDSDAKPLPRHARQ